MADRDQPARSLSAYFSYNEIRAEAANPHAKVTEIAQIMAQRWRDEPEENRVRFDQMHAQAEAQHARDMAAYEQGLKDENK